MKPTRAEPIADEPPEQEALPDKAFYGAFLAALLLIAFVAGAVVTAAGIFPGPQVARAYQEAKRSTAS
jgi:hypothetical protein